MARGLGRGPAAGRRRLTRAAPLGEPANAAVRRPGKRFAARCRGAGLQAAKNISKGGYVKMKRLSAARLLTLGAGALLLVLGIWQGGYRDTLVKAVHICLECVGIG